MAGQGARLRPHTWSRPKQLLQVAGQPLLQHVLDSLHTLPPMLPREFIFITGRLGEQIQAFAETAYPDWTIRYAHQQELLGQSHAVYQARQHLTGPVLLVFSDTLIETDLSFLSSPPDEALAWVREVPDPRRFGVAQAGPDGHVRKIIEKPAGTEYRQAVVGFYYFPSGSDLIDAIEEQLVRDIQTGSEYYLADAVNLLIQRGMQMRTHPAGAWLDAGTVPTLLETNAYLLDHGRANLRGTTGQDGVTIIPPVFIDPSAHLEGSVIGPHVSIGAGCRIENSILHNTIVEDHAVLEGCELADSLVGRNAKVRGVRGIISVGEDSFIESA